jgi:hypothetical protein
VLNKRSLSFLGKKRAHKNLNFFGKTADHSSMETTTTSRGDTCSAFTITNYNMIYLATKTTYYRLNSGLISQLTEDLLFKESSPLAEEIDLLFPSRQEFIHSQVDNESNALFEKCVGCSIECEIIFKIVWQRIYAEQVAMRFISVRFASYKDSAAKLLSDKDLTRNFFASYFQLVKEKN